jgi:uncharacterized RDD family membrane protein YckC
MVNDSVREELALKISPMTKTAKVEAEKAEIISKAAIAQAELRLNSMPQAKIEKPAVKFESLVVADPTPPPVPKPTVAVSQPPATPMPAPPMPMLSIATTKPHTSEFVTKPTSPTLVEFQNKNAVLPDWRLQLQNSVRRRNGNGQTENTTIAQARPATLVTNGATALKAEPIEQPAPVTSSNPMLEKALKRIEESRQKYSSEETPNVAPAEPVRAQPRTYPYIVANKPLEAASKQADAQPAPNFIPKPKLAAPLTEVKAEKFDTNKLPPIPAKISSSFERRPVEMSLIEPETGISEIKSFQIKAAAQPDAIAYEEPQNEEHAEVIEDDRAPIALRFNAGLFDLIIGAFLSVVLLAPFMLSSGNLFTLQGLFAFLATCSIVMFIYLTTTIGTMGRTFGMRLFSLELVDIEENAYPTFHQAAVNSAGYLFSLALGGLGFVTLFLNHEKRAAHDLLSGTIVVREYE